MSWQNLVGQDTVLDILLAGLNMGIWYHQKSCAEFVNSSSSEDIATREAPGSEHDSHSKLKLLVKHYSEFKTLFKDATLELAVS